MNQETPSVNEYRSELRNLEWFAAIFIFEKSRPSHPPNDLVMETLRVFQKYDEDIRNIFEKVISSHSTNLKIVFQTYSDNPDDYSDLTGKTYRDLFPNARIVNNKIKIDQETYRIIIIVNDPIHAGYIRFDFPQPKLLFNERSNINYEQENQFDFRFDADIRNILANIGVSRKLTFAAGSPGWGTISMDEQNRASKNRNLGKLDATKNDFNSLFNLFMALTPDNKLPGINCIGLVERKDVFMNLLINSLKYDKTKGIGLPASGFNGSILIDTKIDRRMSLTDSIATNVVFGPDEDTIKYQDHERLINTNLIPSNLAIQNPYVFISYSGHGNENGEMQIEKDKSITPEEIFKISLDYQTPFVIFLDMCYSHLFGEKYYKKLKQYDWQGIVFTANDGIDGRDLSYEAFDMRLIEPVKELDRILSPEDINSRGVFTAAFCLTFSMIRNQEIHKNVNYDVSIHDFLNLLRQVCLLFHYSFALPLQKPNCFLNNKDLLTDIDGNVYMTVKIGNKIWMAENLNVDHFCNGDPIPEIKDNIDWEKAGNEDRPACCYYENNPANGKNYGRLYNGYAVNDPRGLAPKGWHVPSDDEWKQLEMYLGMRTWEANDGGHRGTDEGGKLKANANWNSPNTGATNESGLTALAGGHRVGILGDFEGMGVYAEFWTSSESSPISLWIRSLSCANSKVRRGDEDKRNGFSVRCVKDIV